MALWLGFIVLAHELNSEDDYDSYLKALFQIYWLLTWQSSIVRRTAKKFHSFSRTWQNFANFFTDSIYQLIVGRRKPPIVYFFFSPHYTSLVHFYCIDGAERKELLTLRTDCCRFFFSYLSYLYNGTFPGPLPDE